MNFWIHASKRSEEVHDWMIDLLIPWPEPGDRFIDEDGKICVFSGISVTGHFIFHPEGEPDMQSSWAWTSDQFVDAVLGKRLRKNETE